MKPDKRDAVKHPERMGPLGDQPEHRKDPRVHRPLDSEEQTLIQEEATNADREQLTTQE
ncbi:MAG TPA: hypothetical protein VK457_07285 [Chloroflexota bacterium]|nr:hypothetical protein [Chloroflexota bacterium]